MTVKRMISYRSVWMGIAIIWIMLYHFDFKSLPGALAYIFFLGYSGVDIFLFASGIGNYYSYLKDEKPLEFFKRRLVKLAPAYVPIIFIWGLYSVAYRNLSILGVIGNLLGVQQFAKGGTEFNWYITCILICYLLTPYLAKFISVHKLAANCMLLLLIIVISVCFTNNESLIIVFTRLPIYVVGMLFAKHEYANIRKKAVVLVGGVAAGSVLLSISLLYFSDYLWSYGLYWYPFILITPGICWMISEVSALLEKCFLNKLVSVFNCLGSFTFEVFLIHCLSLYLLENYMASLRDLWRVILMILTVAVAFAYKSLNKFFIKLSKKKM